MSNDHPPSTLRDLRSIATHMSRPLVLGLLTLVWVLVTLAGPFDTLDSFDLLGRAGYWGAVVFLTYLTGALCTQLVGTRLCRRVRPVPLALGLTAVAVSLAVFAVLVGINTVLFADWVEGLAPLATVYAVVFLISLAIVVLRHVTLGEVGVPAPKPAMLLERLPLDKRGALISLSVQDHYVEIVTTEGREMVLLRLGDAIREAEPVPGLRIHRSHWVALGHVTAAERTGDTARLRLSDGRDLPVSRSYMQDIRAAGLLPRSGGRKAASDTP